MINSPFARAERGLSAAIDDGFGEIVQIYAWLSHQKMGVGGVDPNYPPFKAKGIFEGASRTMPRREDAVVIQGDKDSLSFDVAAFNRPFVNAPPYILKRDDRIVLCERPNKPIFRVETIHYDKMGRVEVDLVSSDEDRELL